MVVRVVELVAKPGKTSQLRNSISETVLPLLKANPGFITMCTLVSPDEPRLVWALTLWRTTEDAQHSAWQQRSELWSLLNPVIDVCQRNQILESDFWFESLSGPASGGVERQAVSNVAW